MMSSGGASLDLSLEDLIKRNKKPGGAGAGGRGRDRASGPGPQRRFSNSVSNRSAPYSTSKAPDSVWNHDMFTTDQALAYPLGQFGGRASSIETGTKLYISNLDYGVSNEDIKELFSEVGDLKRYAIHYDRSGRSKGTAEVVFSRRQDALSAVKRYNDVQLDGKPMKIEIVGTNIGTPLAGPPSSNGNFGAVNGFPRRGQVRSGGFGSSRGGGGFGSSRGGRGFARGRGRGRGQGEKVSSEDLDADLEKYHAEAMQTN